MADHQKIHPVAVEEARPTVPLVPRNSPKSEKGNPIEQYPPFGRNIPVVYSKPPKRRSCCCKCLCWTVSLLILQLIVVGILGAIIFIVFQPKLPKYSVDRLTITNFTLNNDMYLYAKFNVTITAKNPNKNIEIYYGKDNHLSVWYTNTKLCEGSLPKFYQDHQNTTVLNVALTGQMQNGSSLLMSLQQQQEQVGSIPLNLKVNVPVRIELWKLKLMKVKFLVRCKLVVDSLTADNVIKISSSRCNEFRLTL